MDSQTSQQRSSSKIKHGSLFRSLFLWFLFISVLPLTIFSWLSYQNVQKDLFKSSQKELIQSALITEQFISKWFEERFIDINIQAESSINLNLLSNLARNFNDSSKKLAEYVESNDWTQKINETQSDLIALTKRYDYVDDLLLIDHKGNVLYSVAGEEELGTNLNNEAFRQNVLATAFRETLKTGKTQFSDIQHESTSTNQLAGFITAPMVDELGAITGAIAFQLKLNIIYSAIFNIKSEKNSLNNYLVGKDAMLRSPLKGDWSGILDKKINPKIISNDSTNKQQATEYTNINGIAVIGTFLPISIGNINWFLVSEIDSLEAFATIERQAILTKGLLFATVVLVSFAAFFLSRGISKPIIQLANVSQRLASGDSVNTVDIDSNNEIGVLVQSFNHMLETKGEHEKEQLKNIHLLQQAEYKLTNQLRKLEEQKYALDKHAIVSITDTAGNITFANERFEEISGYKKAEIIGENHRLFNSGMHDAEFFENMYHTISNCDVWHQEICNKSKQGYFYWVDTTIVPFLDVDRKPRSYIAIQTDITETKSNSSSLERLQHILVAKVEKLEEVNTELDQFAYVASHDLKSPLNAIKQLVSWIKEDCGHILPEESVTHLNLLETRSNRMMKLLSDLLDYSRISRFEYKSESLNLEEMVDDVFSLMGAPSGFSCSADNIELDIPRIPMEIVIRNLISNAIKHHDQQQGKITISQHQENEQHIFRVHDDGPGIPIELQEKALEMFQTLKPRDQVEGSGMGLAMVKKIVEHHGGELKISSNGNRGTSFIFSWPVAVVLFD